MSTALAVPSPWYSPTRWWAAARSMVLRPKELDLGAQYSSGLGTVQSYTVAQAMSAYAAFPWVVACLDAIGTDLAGLPLRVRVGTGSSARTLESHPVLDLLDHPAVREDGITLRRQWPVDLELCGNWYALVLWAGRTPASLQRLHPERVSIIADRFDGIGGYRYEAGTSRPEYSPDDVLHVRRSSWENGPEGLYGQGLIRALHQDLTTDLQAQKLSAKMSKRGRPEAIISPHNPEHVWKDDVRKQIAANYDKAMESSGGAFVVSNGVKVDLPAWTPKDMEYEKVRLYARDAVLAAFGVPPARVGLPTANYATQREQNVTYWTNLQGKAALFDAALTRLAAMFGGPRVEVFHDFSGADALVEARKARLERVKLWKDLGADPAEAAAYEGIGDGPLRPGKATPAAEAPPAPSKDESKSIAAVFGHRVVRSRVAVPADDSARASLWRGWLDDVHTPAELVIARASRAALRAQAARVVERLGDVGLAYRSGPGVLTRDVVADVLAALFPSTETTAMSDAMREAIRQAVKAGILDGAKQLDAKIGTTRADPLTESQLAQLVAYMDGTTKAKIADEIRASLAAGENVNELQARIMQSAAFGPSRALAVARTETTRSLSAGHRAAYDEFAAVEGITVTQQWLSARDSHVRDAHVYLDGQERHLGELFVVPAGEFAGASAAGPGEFSDAALVVNCRCTTVPIVEEAA